MSQKKENSKFVESLKYSRDKCMLFHGLNVISIGLFVLFFTVVVNEFSGHSLFLGFALSMPIAIAVLSLYLVSRHDLGYIEKKRADGSAIWRDNIEYAISKFAKKVFFQK